MAPWSCWACSLLFCISKSNVFSTEVLVSTIQGVFFCFTQKWYLEKHCVFPSLWWVQWWLRVTHNEQSVPLPAVSGLSELPHHHKSLWFERSDKSAIKTGKFGEAQLCFDISCWFKMPKHRESKPTMKGELQHNCCKGKSKAWGLQAPFILTVYHNMNSWGCWRGNGTRIPFLVVPSEWGTKGHVSCSQEEMNLSRPREMEGSGTMSSSLSSRSSGDRWAGLKSSNSLHEHASSQPLCPLPTWPLWLNLWMFDKLGTDQQEL